MVRFEAIIVVIMYWLGWLMMGIFAGVHHDCTFVDSKYELHAFFVNYHVTVRICMSAQSSRDYHHV